MDELRLWFRNWLKNPLKPGPIYCFKEQINMTQFKLVVVFPPLVDTDVQTREFTYKINDAEPIVASLPVTEVSFEFFALRDANVHMQLVDVDLSGNRSEASVRDFVVTDTVAPHKPGELSVKVEDQTEIS